MSTSAYDGAFRSYTLTRSTTASTVDPDTGRRSKGEAVNESFRVWYKATSSPVIAAQVGADGLSTAVRGRMLSPLKPPTTSHSGAEYEVEGTGQKLTVIWLPPSPIAEINEALGAGFVGKLSG